VSDPGKPVLDASAVLALIQGEKGSEALEPLCGRAALSAVNMAEVLAKLVARGVPLKNARAAIDALHLESVPFRPEDAVVSASFVAPGIALGDRCFLAAAAAHGIGWTSDRELGSVDSRVRPPLKFFR
jgi:PIN domain nuclease of toxin-antitoxin system